MTDQSCDYDVLIAGGGPTGVTLGILLAQRGVSVVIAEKEAEIYPLPRAAHIDHEIMRVLQEAGVAPQVMATSKATGRYDFRNASGKVLLRFDGNDAIGKGGWPMANMIHQPSMEAALRERLADVPGVELWRSSEVTGYRDMGDRVIATIRKGDAQREIHARFLIGADGARSPVRKAAGIRFDDLGFEEPWLVVDAIVQDPDRLPKDNLQICDPARPTTCVVMGEGRHRWEFMIKPGEDPDQVSSDEAIWKMLAPWNVAGAITVERKAVYTFRARVAEDWRRERIMLAGDAAHQTPPFAGQGLCAGVRDAANLAWKLAAVLRDGAPADLLDTYQLEREPHVRAVISMAIMMGKTVCITQAWRARLRDAKFTIARALGLLPSGPPSYPAIKAGEILAGSAAAGSYFPQFIGSNGAPSRLDDVLGNRPWLISTVPVASVNPGFEARTLDEPALGPFRDQLRDWLGAVGAQAVLVRPDRYVFGTGTAADLASAWSHSLCGAAQTHN